MGEEGRKAIMAEILVTINCGYLICEGQKEYCEIFSVYPETTISGTYRLEACKKAEIKELR
jgi:hypothetical protein